jgi:hypothetical protein
MGLSVGGSITIGIRDLALLPQSDEECRAFCMNVIGPECWLKIQNVRGLAAGGIVNVRNRAEPNPELASRDVSVSIGISGTF